MINAAIANNTEMKRNQILMQMVRTKFYTLNPNRNFIFQVLSKN